jgi:hypothetical protein
VLLVVSAAWIAFAPHPFVWDLLQAPKWQALRDDLLEGKRLAIIMLAIATELLIRALDPRPLRQALARAAATETVSAR